LNISMAWHDLATNNQKLNQYQQHTNNYHQKKVTLLCLCWLCPLYFEFWFIDWLSPYYVT
jgi:hypothetical protein